MSKISSFRLSPVDVTEKSEICGSHTGRGRGSGPLDMELKVTMNHETMSQKHKS